ncbi:HDOD domain-containing protein [Candidatus Magnetomonas plexicatena]|uniref:HDOD domain-containing protein n=1 Tax=Candidatus Magnetomonas plexicatena TaxID=2552947 RepID=UPI001102B645|nr:HDOD domain-containing protein [Nitrospirales bacterium LBB_01]
MMLVISHSLPLHRTLELYLKKYFSQITYEIVFNDTDAFKKLQTLTDLELILSDWDDDYVDGYKLLLFTRQNPATKDVPFVMITEKHDSGSILKCVSANVSGYVKKPIDDEIIEQKIKSFLGKVNIKTNESIQKQVNIKSLNIPPCPAIINDLRIELKKPTPAIDKITELIKKDVAVTAVLLKFANSPIYGSGKVDNIVRALQVLGLKNFADMVLAAMLHVTLKEIGNVTETFWKHSLASATLCSFIAGKTNPKHTDSAYLMGLFHDCAMPLLLKKFSGYEQYMDLAMSNSPGIIEKEDEEFSTNHTEVSAMVVKSWKVDTAIVEAIKYHHSTELGTSRSIEYYPQAKELWSIIILAEHLCQYYGFSGASLIKSDEDFFSIYEKAMIELRMEIQDIKDLKDDAFSVIENISVTF